MLDASLAASAALMGLAGTPHCLAMCGATCAAAGGRSPLSFQIGRLLGYVLAGAVAAASMQLLDQMGQATALLRPLWVLVHVAAFLLGLSLLWRGRQPAWLERVGQDMGRQVEIPVAGLRRGSQVLAAPARAGLAGLAWVAWPCGLLQSALLLAALASGPAQGGAVMASFALTSGAGLALGPWLLSRMNRTPLGVDGLRLSVRLGGFGLAAASGWALGHGLWAQIAAACSVPA
ncbi:sulfite exporter TauE/SafE family protein [Paucibacter sp. DJ1R-11]|uniref:sulfite exporter TauE/SafE family protein n=1 Tax=Paucibacter sp. DJ1R-11 TaxID=2893556 RepID=UPI0021E3F777|nr:sulfite exporter TauE/SafE family protein [Paucibacter sp. DJ1R-11]MCV2363562.1 sulfite exporter TauE/SafE family protein [Paucibacter sp. DJ1R-11]